MWNYHVTVTEFIIKLATMGVMLSITSASPFLSSSPKKCCYLMPPFLITRLEKFSAQFCSIALEMPPFDFCSLFLGEPIKRVDLICDFNIQSKVILRALDGTGMKSGSAGGSEEATNLRLTGGSLSEPSQLTLAGVI